MAALRGATLIVAGSLVGQLGNVLCMPLLARVYGPVELGHFSVFVAVVGLLSTTAAFHYELAIPLPRLARDARLLSCLGLTLVVGSAALLCIAVVDEEGAVLQLLGAEGLGSARFMLPVSLILTGCCTVFTMEAVRRQAFGRNAWSKALQGGVQSVGQAGAALIGFGWVSLVLAQLLATVASMLPLLSLQRGVQRSLLSPLGGRRLVALARKYRDLPLAATPASFVNSAVANTPTLLLAAFFSADAAGWYGLGFRVLQVPARFVGQAISNVFMGSAAHAEKEGRLPGVVVRVYQVLLCLALHTFIPIAVVAPVIFDTVFGKEWIQAGRFTQVLSPWLLLGFVVTPLSLLVSILRKQRQELYLQCVYLIVLVCSLSLGAALDNVVVALVSLGVAGSVYLAVKLWWLLGIAACNRRELLDFTVRECGVALLAHVPILMAISMLPQLWSCVLAGTWVTVVHGVNYKVRRLYGN